MPSERSSFLHPLSSALVCAHKFCLVRRLQQQLLTTTLRLSNNILLKALPSTTITMVGTKDLFKVIATGLILLSSSSAVYVSAEETDDQEPHQFGLLNGMQTFQSNGGETFGTYLQMGGVIITIRKMGKARRYMVKAKEIIGAIVPAVRTLSVKSFQLMMTRTVAVNQLCMLYCPLKMSAVNYLKGWGR